MVDFVYRNVTVTGAATLEEARRRAIIAYLQQIVEQPTEQEINDLLAEVEANEASEAAAQQAKGDFRNLPGWATWSGQEAADYLHDNILNGMTKAEAEAWIDANVGGANLAAVLVSVRTALKLLAGAVIDGRDLGHQNEAKAIMYLRDIVRE
jgi:ABC-type uncharacterized transport system ATPase subunit